MVERDPPAQPCASAPGEPDARSLAAAASLLGVMAHPVRLATLLILDRQGSCTVGELVAALGVEQSAVSHHLRLLRDAHLVYSQARGRHRVYQLADHHVGHVVRDALAHAVEGEGPPAGPRAR